MSEVTLRKQARLLMWLVTIPFAFLSVLAVLLVANIIFQAVSRDIQFATSIGVKVAVYYLPMAIYMWAIWMLRRALKSIVAGELFNRIVPQLLMRIGCALFCGALLTELGVPLMTAIIDGQPYFRTFEPSAVTLGVVGAALMLFGQLLRRATNMQEELSEFF